MHRVGGGGGGGGSGIQETPPPDPALHVTSNEYVFVSVVLVHVAQQTAIVVVPVSLYVTARST